MPKCPRCKEELSFFVSVCMDPECCGLGHEICCDNDGCYLTMEYWNDHDFKEAWVELGGKEEDLNV